MSEQSTNSRSNNRPFWRRPSVFVILIVLVIGIIGGGWYWIESSKYEETDDAFIDGTVVPISSKVIGTASQVLVNDNQEIAAGALMVKLDDRDIAAGLAQAQAAQEAAKSKLEAERTNVEMTRANTAAMLSQSEAGVEQAMAGVKSAEAQLASAQADVTAAQAEADRHRADLKRFEALDPRAISKQQLDAAHAAAESADAALSAANKRVAGAEAAIGEAQARVAQAKAVLQSAQTAPQQIATAEAQVKTAEAAVEQAAAQVRELTLQLSYTSIYAPTSGRITRKSVQPGQNVQPNQPLLAIVQPDVWVVANFKETQLTRMRRGQEVDIDVDAYPGHKFHGRIESLQAGTGARFSLLPPENASGNYVKVVQRVPVKIVFDQIDANDRSLLSLGMSVVPRVHLLGQDESSSPRVTQASVTMQAQP